MPHALLLSPDDQAVSAITGVLEEMSVTCERPLDGVSAAHKLNSQSFDLVLVDCENLPAAKLIFDVCRRGKNGNNPVPIAIVDGRAGLPTAFRLGAELILTKPVAKDQARSTIRTAVSRLRKDITVNESMPQPIASAAISDTAREGERAQNAAVSSQLTSFAEPAPPFVPSTARSAASTATISAPAFATKMHSAIDGIDAPTAPKLNPPAGSASAPSSDRSAPAHSIPAPPSDDPVLAEIDRKELEALAQENLDLESSVREKAANHPAADSGTTPVFSSYQQSQKKGRSPLVGLLALVLVGGGLYAAWTYEPGFRAFVQPQIDSVLAFAGIAQHGPAPSPAKPSTQLAPAPSLAPAAVSPTDPNAAKPADPGAAANSATGLAATPAAVPIATSAAPNTAVTPTVSGATVPPVASKPEASKTGDSKKDAAAPTSSSAQLPGENSAIILSSKGAEKRLAHSVLPKYPVGAPSADAQGTVVLKAVIDENGGVGALRVVEGNATLAAAAIEAVKQWRYRPYVRDGKTLPFQTVIIVDFQRP